MEREICNRYLRSISARPFRVCLNISLASLLNRIKDLIIAMYEYRNIRFVARKYHFLFQLFVKLALRITYALLKCKFKIKIHTNFHKNSSSSETRINNSDLHYSLDS